MLSWFIQYDVYICLYEPVLSSGAVIWRERKRKRRRSCGEEVEWGGVRHRCGGHYVNRLFRCVNRLF
jgi:hypothetical protein